MQTSVLPPPSSSMVPVPKRRPMVPLNARSLSSAAPSVPPSLVGSCYLSADSVFRHYHSLAELHNPTDWATQDAMLLMDDIPLPTSSSKPSPTKGRLPPPSPPPTYPDPIHHVRGPSWSRMGPYSPSAALEEHLTYFRRISQQMEQPGGYRNGTETPSDGH